MLSMFGWARLEPATNFPKPGVDLSNPANFASIGMTGMPALSAISSVVAAPPGLLTSADLPLRGFAGRFKLD